MNPLQKPVGLPIRRFTSRLSLHERRETPAFSFGTPRHPSVGSLAFRENRAGENRSVHLRVIWKGIGSNQCNPLAIDRPQKDIRKGTNSQGGRIRICRLGCQRLCFQVGSKGSQIRNPCWGPPIILCVRIPAIHGLRRSVGSGKSHPQTGCWCLSSQHAVCF